MRPLFRSFEMFLRQIWQDSMLAASCAGALLYAFLIRFGVPEIERFLCEAFQKPTVLADYYLLFDLFLSLITPYMLCFASSMVMLSEYDENMTGYLSVTPVGKRGYLLSRLVFPAGIAFLASALLMWGFTLTVWPAWRILLACLLTSLLSVAVAMLLFSYSHNRVEGMAMAKLAGIVMLGLPVPFFLHSPVQYAFSSLPSFWISKLLVQGEIWPLLPALLTLTAWLAFLYHRFTRKLS